MYTIVTLHKSIIKVDVVLFFINYLHNEITFECNLLDIKGNFLVLPLFKTVTVAFFLLLARL